MAASAQPAVVSVGAIDILRLRDVLIFAMVAAVAVTVLYGIFVAPANFLHEFAHDGRHLLGAPCH